MRDAILEASALVPAYQRKRVQALADLTEAEVRFNETEAILTDLYRQIAGAKDALSELLNQAVPDTDQEDVE